MSGELSVQAAAASHPSRLALLYRGRSLSYSELAEESQAIDLPAVNLHRGVPGLESALLLYKSLEERRPLTLVPADTGEADFASFAERLPADLSSEVALVLFTSGSEGQPKGVKLSRRALLASANASRQALGWQAEDRWLCALPLSHVGGLSILLRCLVDRKTVVLHGSFDAERVAESILRDRITHVSLVPTMLWRLLAAGFHPPKHLRVTLMGGAALDARLAEDASNAGFSLRPSYGMTESAALIVEGGRALDHVELRIRDERLEIKGPMLMDGYLPPHQPQELKEGEWFRTQDRASIDAQGHVSILGRADELIISGGENIDPRVVEAGLNQCPAISESYAMGLPHSEWGQILVALVVPSAPDTPMESLEAHRLVGHLRPKELILVSELPLLANGKVDRDRARQIVEESV